MTLIEHIKLTSVMCGVVSFMCALYIERAHAVTIADNTANHVL